MTKTACLLLADGFEETEAIGAWDFLLRAGFTVQAVGVSTGHAHHASGAHGIRVVIDRPVAEVMSQTFDVVICPGGMPGSATLGQSKEVKDLLSRHLEEKKHVAAICAAPPLVLVANNLMPEGVKGVCYPGMEDKMGKHLSHDKADYHIDGQFITAKGPSAALSFGHAICKALGVEAGHNVWKGMNVSGH